MKKFITIREDLGLDCPIEDFKRVGSESCVDCTHFRGREWGDDVIKCAGVSQLDLNFMILEHLKDMANVLAKDAFPELNTSISGAVDKALESLESPYNTESVFRVNANLIYNLRTRTDGKQLNDVSVTVTAPNLTDSQKLSVYTAILNALNVEFYNREEK